LCIVHAFSEYIVLTYVISLDATKFELSHCHTASTFKSISRTQTYPTPYFIIHDLAYRYTKQKNAVKKVNVFDRERDRKQR